MRDLQIGSSLGELPTPRLINKLKLVEQCVKICDYVADVEVACLKAPEAVEHQLELAPLPLDDLVVDGHRCMMPQRRRYMRPQIDCNIQQVKRALDNPGELYVGVTSLMPGLTAARIGDI